MFIALAMHAALQPSFSRISNKTRASVAVAKGLQPLADAILAQDKNLDVEKEAEKHGLTADILLEVNVAEEDTKFGLKAEEVFPLAERAAALPHVCLRGLMTVAPFVENPEKNRTIFANLHKLYVDIKEKNMNNVNMDVLSMGMTNDYEVAVEEGATMVRVGTGIFGARDYSTR